MSDNYNGSGEIKLEVVIFGLDSQRSELETWSIVLLVVVSLRLGHMGWIMKSHTRRRRTKGNPETRRSEVLLYCFLVNNLVREVKIGIGVTDSRILALSGQKYERWRQSIEQKETVKDMGQYVILEVMVE